LPEKFKPLHKKKYFLYIKYNLKIILKKKSSQISNSSQYSNYLTLLRDKLSFKNIKIKIIRVKIRRNYI
jgi:hypothetical protein